MCVMKDLCKGRQYQRLAQCNSTKKGWREHSLEWLLLVWQLAIPDRFHPSKIIYIRSKQEVTHNLLMLYENVVQIKKKKKQLFIMLTQYFIPYTFLFFLSKLNQSFTHFIIYTPFMFQNSKTQQLLDIYVSYY